MVREGAASPRLELDLWRRRVPTVLQEEPAECALACLAMIGRFHGLALDLRSLRERHPVAGRGMTLRALMDLSQGLGISGRALRLEPADLRLLRLPCILHWDLQHFVVLTGAGKSRFRIHDPAVGRLSLTRRELAQHFSGVALELEPSAAFIPETPGPLLQLRDLLSGYRGLARGLSLIVVLSLLLQVFALLSPLYLQLVVDEVIVSADRDLLLVLAFGFCLLLLVDTFTGTLRQWILVSLEARFGLHLSLRLLRHLLRLPVHYFQSRSLGDVSSRFSSMDTVRQVFSNAVVTVVVDGLLAVLTLIVMWHYSVDLTLVVLLSVALLGLLQVAIFPALRQRSRLHLVAAARAQASFLESVRNVQVLKLQEAESNRETHWHDRQVTALNRQMSLARLGLLQGVAGGLLSGLQNILVVFLAAGEIMDNSFSIGMFFAYMSFKQRFTQSIEALIAQALEFRLLRVHLDRLADIVQTSPDRPLTRQSIRSEPYARPVSLCVRDLSFSYGDSSRYIFRNLDLDISPGEMVAIAGASGCGKSTLLKCLAGLYTPVTGTVLLDDEPLTSGAAALRARLAMVTQDDTLLSASLADNIAGTGPELDWAWMIECSRQAGIHDEIERLPMKYATQVGESGAGLSGGQVQRICLARALYRRPGLLVLDEAFSQLDEDCEHRVSSCLRERGMTCLIVAHRRQTLARADRVITLDAA